MCFIEYKRSCDNLSNHYGYVTCHILINRQLFMSDKRKMYCLALAETVLTAKIIRMAKMGKLFPEEYNFAVTPLFILFSHKKYPYF